MGGNGVFLRFFLVVSRFVFSLNFSFSIDIHSCFCFFHDFLLKQTNSKDCASIFFFYSTGLTCLFLHFLSLYKDKNP